MDPRILWADDEIELLKPHVLFLEEKGYKVDTVTSGNDAIDAVKENNFDIIFLDENMPGLSGLETLTEIKTMKPSVPVVMITKSEEEAIMEEAIGAKISDYLIKPVNPKQILLSIKKNLDEKRLQSEKTTSNYQQEFRQIGITLGNRLSLDEWQEMYDKLVYWDLELERSNDGGMEEIFKMQKEEANSQFCKFIERNYVDWLSDEDSCPDMSHNVFKRKVLPKMDDGGLFVILIDNLRYDQWKMFKPILSEYFHVDSEEMFMSILPTATHYSRNAFFAGMMPSEIEKMYPNLWLNEEDDGGKNMNEQSFIESQLKRNGKNVKFSYNKITNLNKGKKLLDQFSNLFSNDLNVIVYNFVDMLSHARTDMEVIRELADDESAYRSLTLSWFEHSPLLEMFKKIAENGSNVVIATDHGTINVKDPVKVVGDKNTNTNLRYKLGRNLNYESKHVFEVHNPDDVKLPKTNVSSKWIFAKSTDFFVYPNNYNYYVNYFRNTFQHGGISLEEMMIPFVSLRPK
ncbi:MAG: bifunctional response regulator/alkaline phosphatase family protein [Flavobacteriales bacterium]|nr:bifunctional response regulator/alkaline phosphatase family protein [Flavobacteriales bacterium]